MANAVVIAAPSSHSGKTVVTLALLAALRESGVAVAAGKIGPDYIDPAFHSKSAGRPCFNLDPWAMRKETIAGNLAALADGAELVIIEGVMGLYDGPEAGKGSTADFAIAHELPVVLVVNCAHQAQSVAALVHGFSTFSRSLNLAGVILNHVSSPRHARLLREALEKNGIVVLGAVPKQSGLTLPSRHLGLVQASEHPEIAGFIKGAGALAHEHIDLERLRSIAAPLKTTGRPQDAGLAPLGQRIAVARDEAFGFVYPHLLDRWHRDGCHIDTFSPLADEPPAADADAVLLPGGYPELHAGRLAANSAFLGGLRKASGLVYGECGGYMVLGRSLIDKDGNAHAMAGLLNHATSFAERSLTLGYRRLTHASPLPWPKALRAHEFHFSTMAANEGDEPLFCARDTAGNQLANMGGRRENVMGSYAHVIDAAPAKAA